MANINEKIILQDQASATLKKVANEANKTSSVFDKMNKKLTFNDPKLSQGFKDLGSKFDGLKNKFSTEFPKFAQSFGGMGGIVGDIAKINPAITAAVAAIGVYAGAMKGYFALTNEYVNAFTEAMQAETSLGLASLNRRGRGDVSDITKISAGIESKGVVGGDELVMGATKLMQAGNINEASSFQSIMADMMVSQKGFGSTGADAEKAAEAINKALNGQIKGLQEYGVYVDNDTKDKFANMTQLERSAFIQDKLTKSVGGFNETFAKSPLGVKKSFENAFGNIKESVGAWAVGAIGSIYGVFKKYLPLMERVGDVFGRGLSIAGNALAGITDALFGVFEALWEIGSAIVSPIIEVFSELGKMIGLGDDLTQQLSYTFRAIGITFSYFGKTLGTIADFVGDGFMQIGYAIIANWYNTLDMLNTILPKAITEKFDIFKNANENYWNTVGKMQILDNKSFGDAMAKLGTGFVEEILAAKETAGKSESFNLLEEIRKALGAIDTNTKETADNTRKMGDIDEEYLNNVRDYFVTRNTWNSQNSQIDSRQYNINMAGKNINMDDISNSVDDNLGMGY